MLHGTETQDDYSFLRLRIDDQGRMFIREEVRELLTMFPKSYVFLEKSRQGFLKLKIQRRGEVVRSWVLIDANNFARDNVNNLVNYYTGL